jgi:hypothetical protein
MDQPHNFIPEFKHGNYPPLDLTKVLAARIIAAKLRIHAKEKIINNSSISRLLEDLFHRANTLGPENDSEDFESYLLRIHVSLGRDHEEKEPKEVLEKFGKIVKNIGCKKCLSKHAHGEACKNDMNHDRKIKENGDGPGCWSIITLLFEDLIKLAAKQYGDSIKDKNLTIRLEPRLNGSAPPTARTFYPPSDKPHDRRATIHLLLPHEKFDTQDLKQIPYLIFHEVCVHAPESWNGESRSAPTPNRTSEYCSFREGFVDAAAASVLTDWMHKNEPEIWKNCSLSTQTAHLVRAIPLPGGTGIQAAEKVAKIMEAREDGISLFQDYSRRFGMEKSAQLAFSLNLLDISEDDRRRLMIQLQAAIRTKAAQGVWLKTLRTCVAKGNLAAIQSSVRSVLDSSDEF